MAVRSPLRSDPPTTQTGRRAAVLAVALDTASVLLFVLIGRRSHEEDGGFVAETAKVAASFLIALAVGWLVARAWQAPRALRTGVVVWAITVAGGMALRPVFGRSVELSFVIVTAAFTALTIVGWRVIARQVASRRARWSSVV